MQPFYRGEVFDFEKSHFFLETLAPLGGSGQKSWKKNSKTPPHGEKCPRHGSSTAGGCQKSRFLNARFWKTGRQPGLDPQGARPLPALFFDTLKKTRFENWKSAIFRPSWGTPFLTTTLLLGIALSEIFATLSKIVFFWHFFFSPSWGRQNFWPRPGVSPSRKNSAGQWGITEQNHPAWGWVCY